MRKLLILMPLLLSILMLNDCKKDSSDIAGTWQFTIVYHPDGGQQWSESGTAVLTIDGNKVTADVTMNNGNKHVRYFEIDGNKVIMKGSFTQPVESEPDKNETITYDGEGTYTAANGTVNGTYNLKIPDFQVDENGTFELTATKK